MRNLLPHFISEQFQQNIFEGTFRAITLFADVSGFTPMTEELMRHGSKGAEALSQILNAIFTPLVDVVYRNGGFISNFSGDAFTAIFPDTDSLPWLLQSADKLRAVLSSFGLQQMTYGDFDLEVRTGMSVGEVQWEIVGANSKAFFFRGEALDNCAAGKHRAERAEIVIDEAVMRTITPGQIEVESAGEGFYRVLDVLEDASMNAPGPLVRRPLSKKIAREFLPEAVVDFHGAGEFRDVASMFISFEGISQGVEMNRFASIVLERANEFSGYVKEIELIEGGVIPCFFGAPVAFENSIERALDFILAVQGDITRDSDLSTLRMRAGISFGHVFVGMIGGSQRSQYALIGSMVNLAARMAATAPWGQIYVSEKVARLKSFEFQDKGAVSYKGITQPVTTYALIGKRGSAERRFFSDSMIGRGAEMRMLKGFAEPIFERTFAGVAYIYGEAGIGKSQLAHSSRRSLMAEHDLRWFVCQCDQILRKPFNPFISFLRGYFSQAADNSGDENKAAFEQRLDRLIKSISENFPSVIASEAKQSRTDVRDIPFEIASPPSRGPKIPRNDRERWANDMASKADEITHELMRTRSVIGALIGLFWDASLYEQLDAKGRYENTLFALKTLLLAESLLHPVVIQIEDGHWIDSDSAAVIAVLTRNIVSYPILLLVTSRYNDDGTMPRIDLEDVPEINLRVNNLAARDLTVLAESEIGGQLNEQLQDLLMEKTRGNPFFVQQLLLYFKEHDALEQTDDGWRVKSEALERTTLPGTISAMLIARIDRLSARVKDVVKAAAVIGQEFDITLLAAVLKNDLTKELKQGEQRQIWALLNELRYIFKHALLRDAAYEMQLHARLRELHRLTAEAMEELYAEDLDARASDIAHHYVKAEVIDKTIEYLEKGGDYAKEQYQNQRAIELYDRLLEYLKDRPEVTERWIEITCRKAEVLELMGSWQQMEGELWEALRVAEASSNRIDSGKVYQQLGWCLQLCGRYDEALECYRRSLTITGALGNRREMSHAIGNMGLVHYNQGRYAEAMECYGHQLAICEELRDRRGMSYVIGNIGNVHYKQGRYDEAMECYGHQLVISEQLGDRRAMSYAIGNIGNVQYNQGRYAETMECYGHQLVISEELGDRRGMSVAIGNMGTVHYKQGRYEDAMECFGRQLLISEDLGNRRGMSYAIGNMGDVHYKQGRYEEAMACFAHQLTICEDLGDRNGMSVAISNMGLVHYKQGRYDEAMECYSRSLAISEQLGDRREMSHAIGNMGDVHHNQGRYAEAMEFYRRKLAICEELGDRSGMSYATGNMGLVHAGQGRYAEAMECFYNALNGYRAIGELLYVTSLLDGIGRTLLDLALNEQEEPEYLRAYLPEETGGWREIALRSSRANAEECCAISQQISKPDTFFSGSILLARLEAAEGRREFALQRLQIMLAEAVDDDKKAELHYWLWNLTPNPSPSDGEGNREEHRAAALRLYETLLENTPKQDYRSKIELLRLGDD